MANWEVLNKKFDNIIDNISDENFKLWKENRENKKEMRRLEMILKAKIQEEKIAISKMSGLELIHSTQSNSEIIEISTDVYSNIGNTSYAMAA